MYTVDSRIRVEPRTLRILRMFAPFAFASRTALRGSIVSPDWLIARMTVFEVTKSKASSEHLLPITVRPFMPAILARAMLPTRTACYEGLQDTTQTFAASMTFLEHLASETG